jgi:hypothetical protein
MQLSLCFYLGDAPSSDVDTRHMVLLHGLAAHLAGFIRFR